MRKPNFLIVGAAKSGTTSLFQYLRSHPDVFMPELKETSYFAGFGTQTGVKTQEDYLGLFEPAEAKRAVGEASGAYLYAPGAARAIREFLGPDVRIVIILRNPIDMAYSLWGHMVRDGAESLGFFDALAAEESRMADPGFHLRAKTWPYNSAYVARARYARQVAAYLRTFPQVRVFIFEEFFSDAAKNYAELCRFLGIGTDHHPVFDAFNRSAIVRSARLRRLLEEPSPWKDAVKAVTPDTPRIKLKAWLNELNYKVQELPSLSPRERERLWRLFAPDVSELEALLGRRLDCWSAQPSRVSAPQHVVSAPQWSGFAHDR